MTFIHEIYEYKKLFLEIEKLIIKYIHLKCAWEIENILIYFP